MTINRENYGGPVDSEASYFRDAALVRFPVLRSSICPRCQSPEVWQPMQTMDMPMVLSCLRCGLTAPTSRYE